MPAVGVLPRCLDTVRDRVERLGKIVRRARQRVEALRRRGVACRGDQGVLQRGHAATERPRARRVPRQHLHPDGKALQLGDACGLCIRHPAIRQDHRISVTRDTVDPDTAAERRSAGRQLELAPTVPFRQGVRDVRRHDACGARVRGQPAQRIRQRSGKGHCGFLFWDGDGSGLRAGYRLMLVVSCNISSTVWITLAFDE